MRTTVTLDEDVAAALQRLTRERGAGFKQVLNDVLRRGLADERVAPTAYRVPARDLGLRPGVDLTKALQMVAAEEDEETLRKTALRK